MMTKNRMRWVLVGLSMLCSISSGAQQHAIGRQSFGSFSGGPDVINLGNLNVHLDIPVLHKQGRGIPFIYDLSYDSAAVWSPVTVGSATTWTPQSGWGWPAARTAVGYITAPIVFSFTVPCNPIKHTTVTDTSRVYAGYVDIHGTLHHASGLSTFTITGDPACTNGQTNGLATTDDGSGYTISIPYGNSSSIVATVTSKSGAKLTAPIGVGNATVAEDNNGNEITFNSAFGQFFDTLSAATPVLTVTGTSPVDYTYTPPSGTPVSLVVSYKSYPVQTHFQCSTVTDYGASSPIYNNLVDKVTLADGSFYQFTYEPTITGSQNVTGRIASVTLPTGGTISYAYTGNNGGINCADGSTLGFNRTTPDSVTSWQYSRSGSNPNWTTTVIDPLNNTITYTMYEVVSTTTNGQASQSTYTYYETNRAAPGETILTCYNANYANCASASVSLPISQLDTYRTLGTKTALSESIFDTSNNNAYGGRLKEQKVYDFGVSTGSAPSSTYLLTDTVVSYASLTGIIDHPYQITVKDAGGHTQSQTTYAYDAGSVTTTTAPQHVAPPNGSRGNLTSVSMWISGTSTLSKSSTYYDTGNVKIATDANGATTTYTYGACGSSFPTQIAFSPITPTQKMAWDTNCTGAVMTSYTDLNNNVSSTSYTTDPYFWRPEYTTDLAGNTTNLSYPSFVEAESTLTFNSSVSDHRIKLDSLGRPSVSQTKQAPSGNYDSVETSYDALGRPSFVSLAYSAGAGALCSGSCYGVSTSYDALGRVQTASDSGGGAAGYTYPNNDAYQSIGPAPTGEATKDKQMEYDGADRLTSVCEVLTSGGTSCGQNGPASGYKTSYAYSVPAAGGSQMVVTQGSETRTYVYDGLGRVVSETNPETGNRAPGTTTYSYDAYSFCWSAGADGDLHTRTDNAGNVTCYHYDLLHRLIDVARWANNAFVIGLCQRLRYDTVSSGVVAAPAGYSAATANTQGRLIEAETDDCSAWPPTPITDEWFSYDARGEMTDMWEKTPNSGGYYHTTAGYAPNGALTSLGLPAAAGSWTYALDPEGRPFSASNGSTVNVASVTYNPASQPLVISYSALNKDKDTYTYYDTTGRMHTYAFTIGTTPKTITGTYGWNQNGTLQNVAITDPFYAVDQQTCNYQYDDLARLGSVDCGATFWQQNIAYDAYGNITKTVPTNGTGITWNPGYTPANNQYALGSGATYDNDGNLTYDTFNHYTWDGYGQMATINTQAITYDAFGREVEKSNPIREILYSPVGKVAIMNGATTVSASFVPMPGGSSINQTSGSTLIRHLNLQGTASALSTLGNRSLNIDKAFAPFGEVYNVGLAGGGETDFAGLSQDTLTGVNDSATRKQYPNQGRWLSPDPAGLAAVNFGNPQTWNRYAYVMNNPLSNIDPLGLFCMVGYCNGDGGGDAGGGGGGSGFDSCFFYGLFCGGGGPGQPPPIVPPNRPGGGGGGKQPACGVVPLRPCTPANNGSCSVAVSCTPIQNPLAKDQVHCGITTGANGTYTRYDGGPNGSGGDSGNAALSTLKVTVTGGTFPPPGNIIFNSAVSCGVVSCIGQVAYQINTANAPYTLLPMAIGLTPATSNSSAQAMTSSCTLDVSYPFNAPGANP
jgi:RHS repeat-associated protein